MNDEYAGLGGSYLLDPVTGKRTLLAHTLPAAQTPPVTKVESATPAPAANTPAPAPEAQTAPDAEADEPTH